MSAITDWASKEQVSLDAISASLDTLITNLQNSPGTLSASDQAALDAIATASSALVSKVGAIVVTPPAVPTAAKL